MTRWICLVVYYGLAIGGGLWSQSALAESGDAAKGKATYEKNCQVCHGQQGKGDGPVGRALIPPPPDFTSPAIKEKSDVELLLAIKEGRTGTSMPGWKGKLSESEIQDVLTYIRLLAQ